ncbi:MAG: hypothetical protein IT583_06895 [Verrucomicrobia bacterium]|nr:hypothetical protein [Verrucomicrobiota bacterium]
MNLPKELTVRIADHLSKVRKNLSSLPPDEQKEILQSIESHIYDALQSKSDAGPTSALLEAVLAEMDPPESYGDSTPVPDQKQNRHWRTIVALLILITMIVVGIKISPKKQKEEVMKHPLALTVTSILAATNLIAGETQTGLVTTNNTSPRDDAATLVEVKRAPDDIIAKQKENAKHRMRKDSKIYSQEKLQDIESLYQVANKQWRSEEGKESLRKLISKYSSANRTGCATLYLGQMSVGDEQIEYLQKAINDFSDCFYGDGAQVGAYARFVLLHRYRKDGENEKAAKLAEEIRTGYPDSIDHQGRPIVDLLKTVKD